MEAKLLSNSGGDNKGEAESWTFPAFSAGESVDVDLTQVRALTAGDLETLQKQAMQEASEKGYQEGLAKGLKVAESQIKQKLSTLESVMQSLAAPYDEFDERVEKEIATLAIQIAKQLVRRELKADSGEVVGVVKEALAALPSSSQNIRMFLHPDDAALVKAALSLDETEDAHWTVVADPIISRGGCRVITDASTIDASIENRLATIIAQALGDERSAG